MNTNLYLNFSGNCSEAFSFYEKVFGSKRLMTMTYGEAPQGAPVPADWSSKVMHTAMPVGSITLMGCDAPPNRSTPLGGFHMSLDDKNEAEVKRLYAALSEGGSVTMPLAPTFWSPLFGMCQDKFGVSWMVSVPGQQPM
jgi:PhnB protein